MKAVARAGTEALAPKPPAADAAGRALSSSSANLVALIARLRDATTNDPAGLRHTLAEAVARFESEARSGGVDEPTVAAASYLLCSWADEQFASTPWGAGGAGLLQRFHGEADGGDRLLRLLARLAEQPRTHHALLVLFHAALSLGLRPRGLEPTALEQLRARVYRALQQVEPAPTLSPPWQPAAAALRGARAPRLLLSVVLLLALGTLGGYTAGQVLLAQRVDAVLATLQSLTPPASVAPAAGAVAPPVARLGPGLEALAGDGVEVRDEAFRSRVVLSEGAWGDRALLARIGAALASRPGRVLVVATSDGGDPPTARLPSGWHQAMDWAAQTADALRPQLGDARLATEARVDPGGAAPRRRVEIVLYPS